MKRFLMKNPLFKSRQAGAVTMFTAVLILILLTEMVLYAVQTGVFEQRKSANEMNQKQAFHVADSAIQLAKQYIAVNAKRVVSTKSGSGWLESTKELWTACDTIDLSKTKDSHPCYIESVDDLRAGSYFYSNAGDVNLPLGPLGLADLTDLTDKIDQSNRQVSLHALLCMLEINRNADPVVQGCTTDPAKQDSRYFILTLAARGQADCDNSGNNCKAEALISEKVGSFGPGGGDGGPGAPLTARTAVEMKGTVEIVPNPNGGGVGVPVSTWVNANPDLACNAADIPIEGVSGSYATCERHEWYGVDDFPENFRCPDKNGEASEKRHNCSCSAAAGDKLISYAKGGDRHLGIDVVVDPEFPCDLFWYTFGIRRDIPEADNWTKVRDMVLPSQQLADCSTLDEYSSGMFWISGDCDISTTVGSVEDPVFLVSAGDTSIHGDLFGVLFVTTVEKSDAGLKGNGHGTIFGAAIVEGPLTHFNGTFQIVYLDNVVETALDSGLFGALQGGWTDFHSSWE